MEPKIQYAKTSDGVSIAFWTLGEGVPLVQMPNVLFSNIEREWRLPAQQYRYKRLTEQTKLIRYDGRGSGLSDRDVTDYSMKARMLDLQAVIEQLRLDRFALWGNLHSGPVAVAYATGHPEQISRLVLSGSYARYADLVSSPRYQTMSALIQNDWETYTETVAHVVFGWSESESARQWAALIRENVTQEGAQAALRAAEEFDVTDLLASVNLPTLVLHVRDAAYPSVDATKRLASGISNARFALVENEMEFVAAILDFLAEPGAPAEPAPEPPQGTAVILFADIVDSTALTERMGDAAFRGKARELDTALRAVIRECQGTPVEGKLVGDGLMAVFTSAREAIEAALRCGKAGSDGGLPLHLGIHAGDVIWEANNVYGGAVNIAARISGLSAPGEVLVSETVRSLARTSAGVRFEDRGEHELKGVSDPVRVWAVREGE